MILPSMMCSGCNAWRYEDSPRKGVAAPASGPGRSSKTPYRGGPVAVLRTPGKDKYAVVLVDEVDVPAKFNIERSVAKIRLVFHRELEQVS